MCADTYHCREKYPINYDSHVWSDGMGNLHQKSLPRCQIIRLKALVDDLTWSKGRTWDRLNKAQLGKFWRRLRGRTVAFWLDTLCIPVGSEYKKFRSLAMRLTYKAYVSGLDVLVLDSELQKPLMPADDKYRDFPWSFRIGMDETPLDLTKKRSWAPFTSETPGWYLRSCCITRL